MAIASAQNAYQYASQVAAILGVDAVRMAPTSSFTARGYFATRQKIGEISTVNGGSVSIFYSATFAEMAK